jgi:hypothetical protein
MSRRRWHISKTNVVSTSMKNANKSHKLHHRVKIEYIISYHRDIQKNCAKCYKTRATMTFLTHPYQIKYWTEASGNFVEWNTLQMVHERFRKLHEARIFIIYLDDIKLNHNLWGSTTMHRLKLKPIRRWDSHDKINTCTIWRWYSHGMPSGAAILVPGQ